MKTAFICLVQVVVALTIFLEVATSSHSIWSGLLVTVLVFAAYRICRYLYRYLKREAREATDRHKAEAAAFFGREADYMWFISGRKQRILLFWLKEKQFYVGLASDPLDRAHLYGPDHVVEWRIDREVGDSSRRWWYEYSLNVQLRDVETPLLKLPCGKDEAMAYKFKAIFEQMCG